MKNAAVMPALEQERQRDVVIVTIAVVEGDDRCTRRKAAPT